MAHHLDSGCQRQPGDCTCQPGPEQAHAGRGTDPPGKQTKKKNGELVSDRSGANGSNGGGSSMQPQDPAQAARGQSVRTGEIAQTLYHGPFERIQALRPGRAHPPHGPAQRGHRQPPPRRWSQTARKDYTKSTQDELGERLGRSSEGGRSEGSRSDQPMAEGTRPSQGGCGPNPPEGMQHPTDAVHYPMKTSSPLRGPRARET